MGGSVPANQREMDDPMTPEAQQIAIAQACGATYGEDQHGNPTLLMDGVVLWLKQRGDDGLVCLNSLPDYLNDLNAMAEAEKLLSTESQRNNYEYWLCELTDYGMEVSAPFCCARAPATHRAQALLRTLEKWT